MIKELYKEAKQLADRGLIVVVQKLGYTESGKKVVLKGMRYKHLTQPDLKAVERYLLKNKDANALGVLMQDQFVNVDFDSLADHRRYVDLGLVDVPESANTRITHTASGKYHYIYQLPTGWFDKYNKTTHINDTDVDVLFGTGNVEYVYPTTLPDGKQYGRNAIVHPTEMPVQLRTFLEQHLAPKGAPQPRRNQKDRIVAPTALTCRELMLVSELGRFGYKDVSLVRRFDTGFDFTYDHSLPDPLDGKTMHDHIDGYCIVNEQDNNAIVGTYSNKCVRKNAFLCYLEEIGDVLNDDVVLHHDIKHIQYDEKYVQPFNDDTKVTMIKSDLGTGKTHQTREHLLKTRPASALILTPRVIFGQCLVQQLRQDNPKWEIYTEIKDGILSAPFLVCQINSIWKLCPDLVYDHIYIDEIESCLNMFSADILDDKRRDCAERLEFLVSRAKRIILCDAHISQRTMDFLRDIGISKDQICYEENTFVSRDRVAWSLPNDETLLWKFRQCLLHGKIVVFYAASKSFIKNQILPILQEVLQPEEYLVYLPTSTEKRRALKNAEVEWSNRRAIVYNSTITVGVDFNLPDVFDTVLVYAQNFGCGPVRDIFQAIHRVRKIRDNEIWYWLGTKPEPGHTPIQTLKQAQMYVDCCVKMRDWDSKEQGCLAPTWVRNLHVWNILEIGLSKNRFQDVFEYYLTKTGYKKKAVTVKEEVKDTGVDEADDEIAFDDIPDISVEDYLELEAGLRAHQLDAMGFRQYYKFLFQQELNFSKELFPLMLFQRGRRVLRRVDWELKKICSSDLVRRNLDNDYLETMNIDTMLLDQIRGLTGALGLQNSIDETELTIENIEDPKVKEIVKGLSNILSLPKNAKDLTRVSHIFKYWNGLGLEPVKTKSGKGIKKITIDGKRQKVYSLQGNVKFK